MNIMFARVFCLRAASAVRLAHCGVMPSNFLGFRNNLISRVFIIAMCTVFCCRCAHGVLINA